jgi:hypothetical protein
VRIVLEARFPARPPGTARRAGQRPTAVARRPSSGRFPSGRRLVITTEPETSVLAEIDEVAEDGGPLVVAVHRLCSGLVQEFGLPECRHLTANGTIRLGYSSEQHRIVDWATSCGVRLVDVPA